MLSRPTITDRQKEIIKSFIQKNINQILSEVSDSKKLFNLFWAILFDKNEVYDAVTIIRNNPMLECDDTLYVAGWHISNIYEGKLNRQIYALDHDKNAKLSDLDIKFTVAFLVYDEMKKIIGKEILAGYTNYEIPQTFQWLGKQLSALSLFEIQEPSPSDPTLLLTYENMHQALLTFEKNIFTDILSPKSSHLKKEDKDWETVSQDGLDDIDETLYRQARL